MSERLYRKIATSLRDAIADGRWPIGSRLPPEPDLAGRFDVSRTTIRQALGELESQGLIERRRRHGTTVIAREPDGLFRMDTGELDALLGLARDTVFAIDSTRIVQGAHVVELAALAGDEADWLEVVGGRHLPDAVDGCPFSWSWIWVPARFRAISEHLGPETRSIYGALEREFGIRVTRVAQRVTARRCPAAIATRLGIARGWPALEIVATLYDADDEPIECTQTLFDPARFQVHSDTRVHQGQAHQG